MLADHADFVIGVDTHKDSHTAAVLSAAGATLSKLTVPASGPGYRGASSVRRQRGARPKGLGA